MDRIGGQAIVIGAGIGGLLAARALSDYYDAVTIVERDALDDTRLPRKGVPQGRHVHGLLARGSQTLDRLFPGFTDDVLAEGATPGDIGDALSLEYAISGASWRGRRAAFAAISSVARLLNMRCVAASRHCPTYGSSRRPRPSSSSSIPSAAA